ncbi:MAG TPA: CHAP domain-containing protein, partial [Acidimicrobiales bacterium]|nr:CHAP domain-containing protein [Acidimicrobiales bacterium]
MRAFRILTPVLALALVGPLGIGAWSPSASAATASAIAELATANIGKQACSVNSLGGRGFESSCTGNGGEPEYWCADFAKWVWANAGVADTSLLNPLAGSFYLYGQQYGTLSAVPAVGDAAVFNYYGGGEAEHVAIVTQVNPDGTIETVSGDFNGDPGVESRFASTSSVVLNAPAYLGVLGTTPDEMGMTISAF